jgi:hypothetical protein
LVKINAVGSWCDAVTSVTDANNSQLLPPNSGEILWLIQRFENFINESRYIPATAYFRSKVLLGLISKLLTTSRAVCCLVDAGFYGEAFGLSRTLIEIFLTVRYITNDKSEARAKLYAEYIGKTQAKLVELSAKHYPEENFKPPGHEEFEKLAENYKNANNWADVRGQIKHMAMEPDTYEVDKLGQPLREDFDYEFIYWQTSHYAHATIVSLFTHATPVGEPFRIRGNQNSETLRAHQALFNVVVFVCKTFVCAFRGLRDEQPEELLREGHGVLKSYARAVSEFARHARTNG